MASNPSGYQIRSAILLLLAEEPHNGFELINSIKERTGGDVLLNDATIYPAMDDLEAEGLVCPAEVVVGLSRQRPFTLTDAGREVVNQHFESLTPLWSQDNLPSEPPHVPGVSGDTTGASSAPAGPPASAPSAPSAPVATEPPANVPVSTPKTSTGPQSVPVNVGDQTPAAGGAGSGNDHPGLDNAVALLSAAVDQLSQFGTEEQVARAEQLLSETRRDVYRILADDATSIPAAGNGADETAAGQAGDAGAR